MLSTVSSLEKNKATLNIEIGKDEVNEGFQKVYQEFSKSVKVPGFRTGKIPKHILINFVGREVIERQVVERLISQNLFKAIEESKIDAISLPKITKIGNIEENSEFRFTVEVEVKPKIEQIQYRGMVLKRKSTDINEIQVERRLQSLREEKAILIPVNDRGIKDGDVVVVDLCVFLGEEKIQPLSVEGVEIEVGKGNIFKEIEDALLGRQEEELIDVEVKMPDDFSISSVAGKEVRYQIKIVSVKQKQLPELDSEFAKEFKCKDIMELREKIKEALKEEAEYRLREYQKEQIIKNLLEVTSVEKSETLVNYEREKIINNLINNLRMQGLNPDDYIKDGNVIDENTRKEIEEAAERNAKISLILDSIVKEENITATEEEINKEIEKLSAQFKVSPATMLKYLEGQGKMPLIREDIIREKVFDLIIENSKPLYIDSQEESI